MDIFIFILFIIFAFASVYFTFPDGRWEMKRFDKKTKDIGYACRILQVDGINIENKGVLFCVRVVEEERIKSISYKNPYKVTDIYINDELVCKIHRLENLFIINRTLEYVEKRSINEINEIIKKAYKISKKRLNEHYKVKDFNTSLESFYSK